MIRKLKINKTYRHFKGGMYKIIAIGKHTETLENMVVYQNLEDNNIWIRPYDMFNSLVDKQKYPKIKQKYRFEEIK